MIFDIVDAVSVKSDRWIKKMAQEYGMIEPFFEKQISSGVVSFGLSSYGYDLRLHQEFKMLKAGSKRLLDPKGANMKHFDDVSASNGVFYLEAKSFVLGRTVEYLRIPRNIITLCVGKSTYARCGVLMNVTPFEPEWEGYPTIQIFNTTSYPVKLYSGEGIAQVIFIESDEPCEVSYSDRKGRYQKQKYVTPAKVLKKAATKRL